jgi:hypothetical protein
MTVSDPQCLRWSAPYKIVYVRGLRFFRFYIVFWNYVSPQVWKSLIVNVVSGCYPRSACVYASNQIHNSISMSSKLVHATRRKGFMKIIDVRVTYIANKSSSSSDRWREVIDTGSCSSDLQLVLPIDKLKRCAVELRRHAASSQSPERHLSSDCSCHPSATFNRIFAPTHFSCSTCNADTPPAFWGHLSRSAMTTRSWTAESVR